MSKPEFTPEQRDAIEARGGTVLVAAAAGSGKTAVLVERVIRMLTDSSDPVDADRLVVVTFTKAAAAEMRDRIDRSIDRLLRSDPDNMALRRQKLLLRRAHINTIHSFCSSCLREFFARAGIAPDFRIADDSEIRAIRAEALKELIDRSFSEGSDDFYYLVEMLGDERSSGKLMEVITELAGYVTAYPDPDAKLDEFAGMYDSDLPVEQTGWGRWALNWVVGLMEHAIALNNCALNEIAQYPEIDEKCRDAYSADGDIYESLRRKAADGQWDAILAQLDGFRFPKVKPYSSKKDPVDYREHPEYTRLNKERGERHNLAKQRIPKLLCALGGDFAADRSLMAPAIKTLCGLVREYRASMAQRKSERKLLDYDDLEHLTAGLLYEERDGVLYRTDTARELSSRYDELLIDEYQDTNYTQDLIFRAISRETGDEIGQGGNLFMVGDIKQSVYGFRKAVPQLFLKRLREHHSYDRENPVYPAKIILDRNFRSRPEVTGAVNFIFEQLMTAQRGGIVYDDEQRLVPGRNDFPEADGMETELHLISTPAVPDAESDEDEDGGNESAGASVGSDNRRAALEARYCARLIAEMVGRTLVTDGDSMRPAKYGDFCILRRGIGSGAGQAFIEQFGALGIPVVVNVNEGYFRQPEVCVILSLLRAVDNPLLDIPLAAALRSPIFGFDSEQLALLRSGTGKKGRIYTCLRRRAAEGDAQCARAAALLEELRVNAAAMPCHRLLRLIYVRTGYLSVAQAMSNGRERRSNLLLLLEYARTSEETGNHGLSGFLRMMERLESDGKIEVPTPADGNCVTVRTMHKSKGLQFPICIVIGSDKNNKVLSRPLPIHERLGIGAGIFDRQRRLKYDSVQREVIRRACFSDEVDEELRVLYVALTRAVDKLIIISAADGKTSVDKIITGAGSGMSESGIEPVWVELSASMNKWLAACALRHPDCDALRERAHVPCPVLDSDCPLKVRIIDENDSMVAPVTEQERPAVPEGTPDESTVSALRASMDYEYPHAGLGAVPAKVTASQTHKQGGDFSSGEQDGRKIRISPARPSFMAEKGLSPTERGTALHRFMQFCDLKHTRDDAAAEVERLVNARFITPREGQAVDLERVNRLFDGPLGEMIGKAEKLYREWRFTVELPAERLPLFTDAPVPDEMVVLQGECDLLLISGGEAVVVDYKTDQVDSTDRLVERYSDQLMLYADAVTAITGLPARCCIYSFKLSELRML